jgi:serine/threonine-protein kinase RsbT
MSEDDGLVQTFEITGGDFGRAGSVSLQIMDMLKEIGIAPEVIRRTAIVAYEAEMNVVMYARKGRFRLSMTPAAIHMTVEDEGAGIPDIELAMQEGYSTATDQMREMGFGAGMGLPNIKKNADRFEILSEVGQGTRLDIFLYLNQTKRS